MVSPGTRLGPYEVLARLGGGGMGDVYRAVDTRLNRTVAIKVLRPDASGAAHDRFRFEREVRAISGSNHPHICALYDVGHKQGLDYLVMEYLQGHTLADRLRRGRLPIDQVLLYGCQIASALGHVHRHGLVHRDVKPSNVMLTETGVKLLDFGIATGAERLGIEDGDEDGRDPRTLTLAGVLDGTVQYMAPETLEGLGADARTDIFALGLVLYEMATGNRPFATSSAAGTIAAVLSLDVRDVNLSSFGLSAAFEWAVRKCLAKSPDDRWQSVEDLRSELEWIREHLGEPVQGRRAAPAKMGRRAVLGWGLAVVLVTFPAAWVVLGGGTPPLRRPTTKAEVVRFYAYPPRGNREIYFGLKAALSPNGRYLASVVQLPDGPRRLWLRGFVSTAGVELENTDGANYPFWSPNSRFIGFFADGQVKSIEVESGRVQYIGEDPSAGSRGATWSRDGSIIVGSDGTGLFLLSKGGPGVPFTIVDTSAGELGHTLPQFLPDGRHFLFLIRSIKPERSGVYLASLDAPQQLQRILGISGEARYVQNRLLFSKDRTLFAQQFDTAAMRLRGTPVRVADGIAYNAAGGRTGFTVSENGVLAYQADGPKGLGWFDRAGRRISSVTTGDIEDPVVSTDGNRLALTRLDPETGKRRIWVSARASRSLLRRLDVPGPWNEIAPVWSPQGDRLLFASDRAGHYQLYSRSIESGAEPELVFGSSSDVWPLDWSPDGKFVLFRGDTSTSELWALPLSGDRRPISLARSDPMLATAKVSPDGKWLAYVSSEVGGAEVFVRPFPFGDPKIQVSSSGGGEPRWRADGRELYYLNYEGALMYAQVKQGPSLGIGAPIALFTTKVAATRFIGAAARNQYDLADNGQRFLISEPQDFISATPMTVVLNWPAILNEE